MGISRVSVQHRKDRWTVEATAAAYRSRFPRDDPFAPTHYMQVPVGKGMTYVPTTDPKHTAVVSMVANLNFSDHTDPCYTATSSDPAVAGIEMHEFLAAASTEATPPVLQPKRWQDVTNTETMTTYGMGKLIKKYTGNLRAPSDATWQSVNNTDRKVLWDFDYAVTLTETVYAADGVTVVGTPTVVVYPAGTLRIECQKWQRITGKTTIYCTNLSRQNLVTGEGCYLDGAVASNTAVIGYVRSWEMALALAGDKYAIKHGLKIGLSNAMLLAGYLWPSNSQDGDPENFAGPIPYGSHIVLPPTYDIEAMQPNAPAYVKAFLYAWQLWGLWVLIRAGSGNVMSFGVEPRSPILTNAQATAIKAGLTAAMPYARVSANSNLPPSKYNASTREPLDPAELNGGGQRLTVGLGLPDIDNATGLKLALPPTGPWA